MDGVFRWWRRTCGIVSLVTALVFAGAWVKSLVDNPAPFKPGGIPLAGKIAIVGSGNPIEDDGSAPQVNWHVTGFYSLATIIIAPESPNQTSARDLSLNAEAPRALDGDSAAELPLVGPQGVVTTSETGALVVPAGFTTEADSNSEAPSSGLPLQTFGTVSLPVAQGSFQVDPRMLEGAEFDDPTDEDWTTTAEWDRYGFHFEQLAGEQGMWGTVLLIPHASVVGTLLLVSALFLIPFRARRSTAKLDTSATIATATIHGIGGFMTGWRRKAGFVTLVLSLTLALGWLRSLVVSDIFNLSYGERTQILLVSGKQGISLVYHDYPDGHTSGGRYRMVKGPAHEGLKFRPTLDEIQELPANLSQFGSLTLPGANRAFAQAADSGIQSEDHCENPDDSTVLPAIAEQAASGTPQMLPMASPGIVSGGSNWIGESIDWAGLYVSVSRNPSNTTIVVPYVFLTIPLTLLSALLLLQRRSAIAART